MAQITQFKHHEYVGDVNYRSVIREIWNPLIMNQREVDIHNRLSDLHNDLPYVPYAEKNRDVVSDIYNHVIGRTKRFPIQEVNAKTESLIGNLFSMSLEYERLVSSMIRKAATLWALHEQYQENKKFNDPICVLYDEIQNEYHIMIGQQRFYYSKVLGVDLEAIVYSLGTEAARKINADIKDIDWNWSEYWDDFFFGPVQRSERDFFKAHVFCHLNYNENRNDWMLEHQNMCLAFSSYFAEFSEEIYYFQGDRYLFFLPNADAKKKIKVDVKDEYSIIQHWLHKFCEVDCDEFLMEKSFEESEYLS